jgi:hypothetical protein
LPSSSQVKKAIASHPDVNFPFLEKTDDVNGNYEPLIQNIRTCAELYRDNNDINVRIYNKIKHVFSIVEGQGWIDWENSPDEVAATILVEINDIAWTVPFVMTQEKADGEMANIRWATEMGAEIMAICICLNELGILYDRSLLTTPPADSGIARLGYGLLC